MKHVVRFGAVISLAWSLGTGASAQGAGPEAGQRLAFTVCAACHVISPAEAAQPKMQPPAPRFDAIANAPGVTEGSIRAFLLTTHQSLKAPPDMPSMLLSEDEATAVARYILSLKTQR